MNTLPGLGLHVFDDSDTLRLRQPLMYSRCEGGGGGDGDGMATAKHAESKHAAKWQMISRLIILHYL